MATFYMLVGVSVFLSAPFYLYRYWWRSDDVTTLVAAGFILGITWPAALVAYVVWKLSADLIESERLFERSTSTSDTEGK